jgi:DNA-binding PadR family transcriptional regulator
MAATETRLLLLGAVHIFGPVNGYQVRQELKSWRVDEWGHINPGSIYSVLNTLAGQGHVRRHAVSDGGREVGVYTLTEAGRAEYHRLLETCLTTVDAYEPMRFHTAVNLMGTVTRAQVAAWLERREAALRQHIEELEGTRQELTRPIYPSHLSSIVGLGSKTAQAEREWLQGLRADIDAGKYSFAGEGLDWTPEIDDHVAEMMAQNQRYRDLLGLGPAPVPAVAPAAAEPSPKSA